MGNFEITPGCSKAWIEGFSSTHSTMAFAGGKDVEANNIGGFGRKVWPVLSHSGLASREVNLVAAQEPKVDILDVNIAQRLGQQRAGPARKPLRALIQQLQNPLVGRLRINRLLARPRLSCSSSRPWSA